METVDAGHHEVYDAALLLRVVGHRCSRNRHIQIPSGKLSSEQCRWWRVPLAVAVGEIVPHDGEAHATAQVTPWAEESPVTVAVNWTVVPTATDAGVGEIETAIPEPPAPGTVIVAEV
jgi:hypothetical protein